MSKMKDMIYRDEAIGAVAHEYGAKHIRSVGETVADILHALKTLPSADRPTLNQTDTLIIADALRYLAEDEERHELDRTRAEELRRQILQYGASMCNPADAVMRDATAEERASVQRYIDSISTEAVQGWIPCSERLPQEKHKEVLITERHWDEAEDPIEKAFYMTEIGYIGDDNEWYSFGSKAGKFGCKILAWMPLPKPYKGGDDE